MFISFIQQLPLCVQWCGALADPGGAAGARPPNRIQFFRFHICFHQKAPTSEVGAPPMGNPGSATGVEYGTDELPSLPETGPGPTPTNKTGKYFPINFEKSKH